MPSGEATGLPGGDSRLQATAGTKTAQRPPARPVEIHDRSHGAVVQRAPLLPAFRHGQDRETPSGEPMASSRVSPVWVAKVVRLHRTSRWPLYTGRKQYGGLPKTEERMFPSAEAPLQPFTPARLCMMSGKNPEPLTRANSSVMAECAPFRPPNWEWRTLRPV